MWELTDSHSFAILRVCALLQARPELVEASAFGLPICVKRHKNPDPSRSVLAPSRNAFVPSSFLFLVVGPGAPLVASLLLVAMHLATSSVLAPFVEGPSQSKPVSLWREPSVHFAPILRIHRSSSARQGVRGLSEFPKTNASPIWATRSKDATRNKCHASSNKCLTSSNKKLLGARMLLGAPGIATRSKKLRGWRPSLWRPSRRCPGELSLEAACQTETSRRVPGARTLLGAPGLTTRNKKLQCWNVRAGTTS